MIIATSDAFEKGFLLALDIGSLICSSGKFLVFYH